MNYSITFCVAGGLITRVFYASSLHLEYCVIDWTWQDMKQMFLFINGRRHAHVKFLTFLLKHAQRKASQKVQEKIGDFCLTINVSWACKSIVIILVIVCSVCMCVYLVAIQHYPRGFCTIVLHYCCVNRLLQRQEGDNNWSIRRYWEGSCH